MSEQRLRRYGPRPYDDHPPFSYPDYRSTILRAPENDLVSVDQTLTETTGPGPVWSEVNEEDADLTTNAATGAAAIGERIIVIGRVLDEEGLPLPSTLIEIWQANACGRYSHPRETDFDAPLDPNFLGVGRCLTDEEGLYRFTTIKPGAHPWNNHPNAWRPAHINFSLLGPSLGSRLVTQMYFPDDPLLGMDPMLNSVPAHAQPRLLAAYDHDVTEDHRALGYRWDIVVRGSAATPIEGEERMRGQTPSQTVGRYYSMSLGLPGENTMVPEDAPGRIRIEGKVLDGEGTHVEDALVEIWQADPEGHYRHPDDRGSGAFAGYGRAGTDVETGLYWFETSKPGPVPDPEGGLQAPHAAVIVQARGMLNPLFTRLYFSDEAEANDGDLVLGKVPPGRRSTLVAKLQDGSDPPRYRFDIRLQGGDETVFFDF